MDGNPWAYATATTVAFFTYLGTSERRRLRLKQREIEQQRAYIVLLEHELAKHKIAMPRQTRQLPVPDSDPG